MVSQNIQSDFLNIWFLNAKENNFNDYKMFTLGNSTLQLNHLKGPILSHFNIHFSQKLPNYSYNFDLQGCNRSKKMIYSMGLKTHDSQLTDPKTISLSKPFFIRCIVACSAYQSHISPTHTTYRPFLAFYIAKISKSLTKSEQQ